MEEKKSILSPLQKGRIFLVIFLVGALVFFDRQGDDKKEKKMAETLFQSISADYVQIVSQDLAILKAQLSDWQVPW